MSAKMKLYTFYRVDGTTLTPVPNTSEEYPLENQQWEPTCYVDEEDGLPYVSGFFSGDHDTFATNEDFKLSPARIEGALNFIPTVTEVTELLTEENPSNHTRYLYLMEVEDETGMEGTYNGLYNLTQVRI